MGSKIFLVLGLLVAIVLLIPMEVAARELAETSANHKQNGDKVAKTNGVYDANYGAYRRTHGKYAPYRRTHGPKNGAYRRTQDRPPFTYPVNPPFTYPVNPPYTYPTPP